MSNTFLTTGLKLHSIVDKYETGTDGSSECYFEDVGNMWLGIFS